MVLGPIDVQARGERMLADFTVTLSGGGRSRWLPQHLGVYQVHSAWKREHGRCVVLPLRPDASSSRLLKYLLTS